MHHSENKYMRSVMTSMHNNMIVSFIERMEQIIGVSGVKVTSLIWRPLASHWVRNSNIKFSTKLESLIKSLFFG